MTKEQFMIKSMTGFGRCERSSATTKITVELKSVNHRYFDVNIRMPRKLNFFEAAIRSVMKEYIQRGKVDVFITYEDLSAGTMSVRYNETIAAEYLTYLRQIASDFGLEDDIRVSTLSRYPEVLTMEDRFPCEEEIWPVLEDALRTALLEFVRTREKEGERLQEDLTGKLRNMLENVNRVEERGPKILEEYRKKLETKVAELLTDAQLDESRISAEIVLFADKICTDEETVRLKSHIQSMLDALGGGDGVGRKLDFIAQEMNRESNTILSKSNDLETSNIAIDLKTEIEKVREQIQNIE